MELKQLNKIVLILALAVGINSFSQMKMADLDNKEFSINSKIEKRNLIKILEDTNYNVYYILNRKNFDLKMGLGVNGIGKIVFFSKKYNKGILVNFEQMTYHVKKNVYSISLHTGSADNYMFMPSMIIVDKDFNYEYLMRYSYIHLPHDKDVYTSSISVQDIKNYCNVIHRDIGGNVINENIDDILSNISKVPKNNTVKKCNPIVYDMDLRDFFPKKIIR
ncbi:hypothetical protein [Chryseobacterium sp.]|uniref:hypothetical protein n=1 Tax=Chryseobacterium sp. TaxID=1871047 RepID=UPI00262716CD|nr:hypothetical protein [Chryseobacterium sp.]